MYVKVLTIVSLVSYVSARTVLNALENNDIREAKAFSESKSSFLSDLKRVYRVYEECNAKELAPCLKMKFITAIDRLSRKMEFPITDSIALVKDDKAEEANDDMDNDVIEATLPRSLDEKNSRLDEIIVDKIANFFAGRSLQFKLSGLKDLQKSFEGDVEGRQLFYRKFLIFTTFLLKYGCELKEIVHGSIIRRFRCFRIGVKVVRYFFCTMRESKNERV